MEQARQDLTKSRLDSSFSAFDDNSVSWIYIATYWLYLMWNWNKEAEVFAKLEQSKSIGVLSWTAATVDSETIGVSSKFGFKGFFLVHARFISIYFPKILSRFLCLVDTNLLADWKLPLWNTSVYVQCCYFSTSICTVCVIVAWELVVNLLWNVHIGFSCSSFTDHAFFIGFDFKIHQNDFCTLLSDCKTIAIISLYLQC